ncbi:Gfo/Idh/MocA family protein [Natrarchaeobius chitinivorans]|uniref:Gfo/Idh/MocA family oxidoreductase n=1 Tax=Natrarchaeobius chitinivorans TaxID=1679083 RepID=A0A3N6LX93_NATCH|nr:Gfo/Idh/MocA family oxidoreductase [Natrarchaeobius chitinivorans]RQG95363.1 gfo/Idh/MocA family oxidoreductase [Natrarchaeobius chitinivorans]
MVLQAGIIGTGGVAGLGLLGMHDADEIGEQKVDESHAGAYERSDRIELVAVADVDESKLETFGSLWDIPTSSRYASHTEMLENEDLDIVSVCSPTFLHHDHVVDAAQSPAAPDAIWCEKPIASSLTNAENMVEVCSDTGTELVINHTSRFTPSMQRLRELVYEEDLIGDVRSVNAQFRMELVRNSTHVLDTVTYLTDADAVEVTGHLTDGNEANSALEVSETVDDTGGGGMIVLDNGAFFTIDCTNPRDISTMAYQIIGTDGRLSIDIPTGEWRYWDLVDGSHEETPLPDFSVSADDYAQGFANAAEHLADLVAGDATNISSGEEALRSLEIIVGIYVSDTTGSKVDLPLAGPLRDVRIKSW